MSRAELWRRNLPWPNWRHVAPSPSNVIDLPDSIVAIMAPVHAIMAKSRKNIALLPNSKIGVLQEAKSTVAMCAKLPLMRAGEVVAAGVAR